MRETIYPTRRIHTLFPILLLLFGGLLPSSGSAAGVTEQHDVVYGTTQDAKLLLDAYLPTGEGKHPAVIMIHGGAWAFGDKRFYAGMCQALAQKGFAAFSINYRLMPAFRYPAPLDDSQRAVRWIRAHASEYNVDPQRIGALGDSAGGYLVAMLGARDTRDNSDTALAAFSSRVQCVVDFYGPTDFTPAATPASLSAQGAPIVAAFLGKRPTEAPELYRDASPIVYVDKSTAPFLILHGTGDTLVPPDQSERLYRSLKKAGVEANLIELYQVGHGYLNPVSPGQSGLLALDFLTSHLKP